MGEIREEGHSETVSTKVDAEVSRIINDGIKSAEKVLMEHKKALDAIAKKLIEVETLEQEEYNKIIIANGIMPKKREEIKANNKIFSPPLAQLVRAVELIPRGSYVRIVEGGQNNFKNKQTIL